MTDIFSRRYGLIFSNFFFALGTLICGLAPSPSVLIFGRAVAGMGGGGLSCIATYVTSDLIPLRRRGLWQGYANLVFGAGMGIGGVFGGAISDTLGWRWAFLIQVPFVLVSMGLCAWLVDVPVNPSSKPKLSRIDFLGSGLLVTSLVLLLLGLNTGGNSILPWSSPWVVASLVLSVCTLATFLYLESTPSIIPEPVLPTLLIARTRTILFACLTNWFDTMSCFLALYYVPIYLQVLRLSPTQAGTRIISYAITTSLGSLTSGLIMRRTGKYNLVFQLCGSLPFTVGTALLPLLLNQNTPLWVSYVLFLPVGWGYGTMLTCTLVAMISAAPHSHQATITAASYAFRSTGSTIGVTVAGAVFQSYLAHALPRRFGDLPHAQETIAKLRASFDALNHLPTEGGWVESDVRAVFVDAVRAALGTGAGLAGLGALCGLGLGMREYVLHGNLARK